ncbi:MFS transporter [Streptomyces sp. NBC_00286]|uniref:MFS transporter n=1 Tax=Streptomyces sp. NBC_00286 TaxID=2975701 RepID=UPI002E2BB6FC|nr:MFS transporter [Streptomyces sp. NBC_00286]
MLTLGQVVGAGALGAAVTIGGFVVEDIVGVATPWVGLSTAAVTAGSGVMAQVLARVMARRGRRVGMQMGYGLAALGGLVACAGVQISSLAVFLCGLLLYGAGSATNLLARYAATDLAEPDERSRAMGRILFAATFGAIFGPTLVGPAEALGQSVFGLEKYAGPWLLSTFFFLCAMVNVGVRLRPDPLTVWAEGNVATVAARSTRVTDSLRVIATAPAARLALLSMVGAQAVMVGVMAMSPIEMKTHHHEAIIPFVVSAHMAGMFASSPLVGRIADRFGRLVAMRSGALVLVLAGCAGTVADSVPLMFVSMFTVGMGWALVFIGASTLLVDTVTSSDRVPVQGTADFVIAVSGGVAGVLCGFLLSWIGFSALALGSACLSLLLLLGMSGRWRREKSAVDAG